MKDEYKKELTKIKAPRELVERTKLIMQEEESSSQSKQEKVFESKTKVSQLKFKQIGLISAAIVIFVVGSVTFYNSHTSITIQALTDTSLSLNPNFGKRTDESSAEMNEKIKIISAENPEIIPSFFSDTEASKIKGHEVKIALDTKGIYHAAYQLDSTYFYVMGKDISEKDFINYLKDKF